MSGCMPRNAATITVPKIASNRLTAKQSNVPMNVTRPTRTGMVYQRGARDAAADVMSSASILMVGTLCGPVRAVPAECMDGSGSGNNFAAVAHAAWNEAFFSGPDRHLLFGAARLISDQGIAAFDHDHVFVELVDV